MAKPIRETPERSEMLIRGLEVKSLRKLLEINAMVISQIIKPKIIAKLYKSSSPTPKDEAVRARTDP